MSRSPRQERDGWEEIRWRLTSLPTRLRGEEPGTSPAEALEDLLLLGVVGALAMIVALFLYTTVHPNPSNGQATTWAAAPTTTGTGSEGTANLKSVPRGRTGSNVGGGGGGGGGGGMGGGAVPMEKCDDPLSDSVQRTAGIRMFTLWKEDRQPTVRCRTRAP